MIFFISQKPDIVINCAAMANVDLKRMRKNYVGRLMSWRKKFG